MNQAFDAVFLALAMSWLVAEVAFSRLGRSGESAVLRCDGASLKIINIAIYVALQLR